MKPEKLSTLADLAVLKNNPDKKFSLRIDRCTFSLDVNEFHIIAKALVIYRDNLRVDDPPPPPDFLAVVEKLTKFFVEGKN